MCPRRLHLRLTRRGRQELCAEGLDLEFALLERRLGLLFYLDGFLCGPCSLNPRKPLHPVAVTGTQAAGPKGPGGLMYYHRCGRCGRSVAAASSIAHKPKVLAPSAAWSDLKLSVEHYNSKVLSVMWEQL